MFNGKYFFIWFYLWKSYQTSYKLYLQYQSCQILCYGTIRILYACSQSISWPLCLDTQYLRYTCVLFSHLQVTTLRRSGRRALCTSRERMWTTLYAALSSFTSSISPNGELYTLYHLSQLYSSGSFCLFVIRDESKLIATFFTLICEFKCDHTVSMKLIIDTPFCTPAFEDEPKVVRVAQGMELEQNIMFEKIYFGWT